MKKVFYIEREEFLRKMLEKAFPKLEIGLCTSPMASDCEYLVEDWSTELLLVDISTAFETKNEFLSLLRGADASQIPVAYVGYSEKKEKELMEELVGKAITFFPKPLNAKDLSLAILEL